MHSMTLHGHMGQSDHSDSLKDQRSGQIDQPVYHQDITVDYISTLIQSALELAQGKDGKPNVADLLFLIRKVGWYAKEDVIKLACAPADCYGSSH